MERPSDGVRLRLEVFRDWESARTFEEEWDRFGTEVAADIHLAPAWCRVWWRHYGRGELRILAVRHDEGSATPGALAAVFPLFISRAWIGPFPLRLAKFIGADSTIAVIRPPVTEECAEACYRLAIDHLLDAERCDAASFGPLGGESDRAGAIRRACAGSGAPRATVRERTIGVHTIYRLPESAEAYWMSLDRGHRSNLRRSLKRLDERFGIRMQRITDPEELREHFPAFVAMHTAQWRSEGLPGHFGDWPGSLAFAEELVRELAPAGRVVLSCLLAAERPVSYFWDFRCGRTAHWRLPARVTGEEEMEKLGLGRAGLILRIETLIPEGIRTVEDGPGHYEYKLQHGAEEFPLRSVLVVRRSPYARGAVPLALAVSAGIHFAYYRVWRRKGLKLLGLRPGKLWRCWIRTRI